MNAETNTNTNTNASLINWGYCERDVKIAWTDIEEHFGRPHAGNSYDDNVLVKALKAAGAPDWIETAEGYVDEGGWYRSAPEPDLDNFFELDYDFDPACVALGGCRVSCRDFSEDFSQSYAYAIVDSALVEVVKINADQRLATHEHLEANAHLFTSCMDAAVVYIVAEALYRAGVKFEDEEAKELLEEFAQHNGCEE
jgi:hypothetical protein